MEKQQKKVSNGNTEVDSTKLFALHAVIPTAGQHYRGSDDDEGVALLIARCVSEELVVVSCLLVTSLVHHSSQCCQNASPHRISSQSGCRQTGKVW